ncbi:MAG: hypothetical protein A3J46_05635 [Candidatus Yanofskybacteria bacterium RIFCSPHIGHO2_02_FULL_41_11]|uniref:Uncharacterized protein n=1 Tax=Candidatus Yanofskybacteria bacterium RIFCSPHIGHO2_02_FULL_41_11 TaxID=1802675 RepID=A0A1F8F9L9_9BACT|nr:MAG: hypothetical protein A3J46_05635 [Candidatus Yanofskybacteria bacterium RIFCSPHIGHO2_02_FULL_41_11]
MGYILGLILILGLIFSATIGTDLVSNLWRQMTDKFSEFIFPRSQREIVIDNLEDQYSELDKFFSSVAPSLIGSKNISQKDKESLGQAINTFKESKKAFEQIKKIEQGSKSITKALMEKILDLNTETVPEPTYIPPNCNLVCNPQ